MSSQPQLSGHILSEAEADTLAKIKELESQLSAVRKEVRRAIEEIAHLRSAIGPFFSAMRSLFSGTPESTPVQNVSGPDGVWQIWKQRLGGKYADLIEVLQLGPKTATQLKNATGGRQSTVFAHLKKLQDMGIVINNGGKYSLKQS